MAFPYTSPRLVRGATPLAFRSATTGGGASTTVTKPSGVAAGDVVVLLATSNAAMGNVTTASGATWSTSALSLGGASEGRIWWRVLNATDVANNWNAPASLQIWAVAYEGKGAASLTVQSTNTATASSSLSVPGYTPSLRSRGTVAILLDTGADESAAPTGFTNRVGVGTTNNNGLVGRAIADDKLTGYAGGAVAWTLTGSVNSAGLLLDIT